MKIKNKKFRNEFTLIELLIVMIILGLLAALVAPKMFGKVDSAKIDTAKVQMESFSTALDTYRLDIGDYPKSLEELRKSDHKDWDGPYISKAIPMDPWGNPYFYKTPGKESPYILMSYGKDGKEGGSGNDADILYDN